MASYHCSIKMLSRSAGRSSVQFSAYMSAEKMKDERLGKTFSHTSKEEVCFSEMLYTDRVPDEIRSPEKFWNEVEAQEKQSNSQVARTWEIALPHELTIEQNQELAKEFAQSLIADGIPAVQFAVHQKAGNWHAHFMAPTRDIQNGKWQPKEKKIIALDEQGNRIPVLDENGNQKFRERKGKGREMLWQRETVKANVWNDRAFAKKWRERVAVQQNAALEKYGHDVRVDHRSYADQGKEKIPQIHEGYEARKIEKSGSISDRCQYNREVAQKNFLLEKISAQIESLRAEMSRKGNELNERLSAIIERRTASGLARTAADGNRKPEKTDSRADRLKQLLERRERENVKSIGTASAGQRENPAGAARSRSADPDDTGARATADILRATEQLAQRKQREAAEAERARKAAQLREQQLEAERKRTAERVKAERARNSKSHDTSRGFSR